MQVEVVKWGNSHAVRLPAAAIKEARWVLGERLELSTVDGKIVLAPSTQTYSLEAMLSGITEKNQHALVDFGAPVGREAW